MLWCFLYIALLWRICNKSSCIVSIMFNFCRAFCWQWLKLAISFKLTSQLVSQSTSEGSLNLIRRLFQTVSELKRWPACRNGTHTRGKKGGTCFATCKPHSHALNDVIMHKTHSIALCNKLPNISTFKNRIQSHVCDCG